MLVGELPGDKEDIQGHPFVGPAGKVLDRGIREAGIPADDVYITNVVKHFRYKARGVMGVHPPLGTPGVAQGHTHRSTPRLPARGRVSAASRTLTP